MDHAEIYRMAVGSKDLSDLEKRMADRGIKYEKKDLRNMIKDSFKIHKRDEIAEAYNNPPESLESLPYSGHTDEATGIEYRVHGIAHGMALPIPKLHMKKNVKLFIHDEIMKLRQNGEQYLLERGLGGILEQGTAWDFQNDNYRNATRQRREFDYSPKLDSKLQEYQEKRFGLFRKGYKPDLTREDKAAINESSKFAVKSTFKSLEDERFIPVMRKIRELSSPPEPLKYQLDYMCGSWGDRIHNRRSDLMKREMCADAVKAEYGDGGKIFHSVVGLYHESGIVHMLKNRLDGIDMPYDFKNN
ncbi:MAG: hypothetical protein HY833_02535 [Candidatus Aenigmarchaeota archaeon]|nr:hypothetical protein [Candidatus Aenigmarchaeota archaeon]